MCVWAHMGIGHGVLALILGGATPDPHKHFLTSVSDKHWRQQENERENELYILQMCKLITAS